jgi:hypothetical protein
MRRPTRRSPGACYTIDVPSYGCGAAATLRRLIEHNETVESSPN